MAPSSGSQRTRSGAIEACAVDANGTNAVSSRVARSLQQHDARLSHHESHGSTALSAISLLFTCPTQAADPKALLPGFFPAESRRKRTKAKKGTVQRAKNQHTSRTHCSRGTRPLSASPMYFPCDTMCCIFLRRTMRWRSLTDQSSPHRDHPHLTPWASPLLSSPLHPGPVLTGPLSKRSSAPSRAAAAAREACLPWGATVAPQAWCR